MQLPAHFSPGDEPYIWRKPLYVFDVLISSAMDLSSKLAAKTRTDPLSDLQRAAAQVLISEAFSFLVSEYGFAEHEKTTDGFLGSVTVKEYSNAKVGVRIGAGGIDTGGFCFIDFESKETGTHCNFQRLLSERHPEFEHPLAAESMDVAKTHLQAYAAALRDHAADVLLGDFSGVHQ